MIALLDHHRALIEASAIAPEVAQARGYFSGTTKAQLGELGFAPAQRLAPALVIPIYNVRGEVAFYLARPDQPRMRDGKVAKYEFPAGVRMALDVPPVVRPRLGDPSRPLVVTEGSRKADAAVSAGLDCVSLVGTWNWRGRNEQGGKTVLPDLEHVAWNDREVYIAYDSDVMLKREVHAALARFAAVLAKRDARLRYVYLPHGEDGSKVGLDDFLAAGHTASDVLALATAELRRPPGEPSSSEYAERDGRLVWVQRREGAFGLVGEEEVVLAHFTARIAGEVEVDDGADVRRVLEITAEVGGRERRAEVPAGEFERLGWVVDQLGADAILAAGAGLRDRARAAIQHVSGEVPRRRVYAQTGWRRGPEGEPVYLHAAGGIGAHGPVEAVDVSLSGSLARFALPAPPEGERRRQCARASLAVLNVAPLRVTVPLLAAVYRAPLGDVDHTLHLHGPTGAGKTEVAALAQQHFGAGMDARHLPGSWSSTPNALEGLLHAAADALITVDDFAPGGSRHDVDRAHRDADRLLRAQGNRAGRDRMTRDATLRAPRPPRGLVLSTGEEVPRGHSLRARMLPVAIAPGDVDFAVLSRAQRAAANGLFAGALAGYVQWVAAHYDALRDRAPARLAALREQAHNTDAHRRTPALVASLALGLETFLAFAGDVGAVDDPERAAVWQSGWRALVESTAGQARAAAEHEPARRFLGLLSSAVASGVAHIAARDGAEPDTPQAWGWRRLVGAGDHERVEWQPQGHRVGWVDTDGGHLYLDRDAAYEAAQRAGREGGGRLTVDADTLAQRLKERGLLAGIDEQRETTAVRRTVEGVRRQVLWLPANALGEPDALVGSPDPDPTTPDQQQHRWSGNGRAMVGSPDQREHGSEQAFVPLELSWSGWSGASVESRDALPTHAATPHSGFPVVEPTQTRASRAHRADPYGQTDQPDQDPRSDEDET